MSSGHWNSTESTEADGKRPQLALSTVNHCNQTCSTFVRAQVRVSTKVKRLSIECFELATNTVQRAQWKREKRRRITQGNVPREDSTKNLTLHTLREFTYDCIEAHLGREVDVTVTGCCSRTKSVFELSHRWYQEEDMKGSHRVPRFSLTVDGPSKSMTVSVPAGEAGVKTRLCYKQSDICTELTPHVFHIIDTAHSLSTNLSFPYLLPCVCVEVYYIEPDAKRIRDCPFKNKPLDGGRDIWLTSSVDMRGGQTLVWKPVCTASVMPSASLCWRVQENSSHCLPVANSTLRVEDRGFNVSIVDQHPQMCVQFALNGTYDVRCPFQTGDSDWQAVVLPASWHFRVSLTSSIPASFSAHLCVLEAESCVAKGAVLSVMAEKSTATELQLPFSTLSAGLCVQVWRSDPVLLGRRVLCPHFSHGRVGLIAMVSVVLVVFVVALACLTYHGVRRGLSDWQLGQKPVLLVCSSEQIPQVSAVCALASLLQGELCAGVRMALWAQNTGGVAKLGPLPWLYGQYEAIRGAGGRVLIAWSPEAREAYQSWRKEEHSEVEETHKEERGKDKRKDEDLLGEETAKEHKGEKSGQREPSSVTVPILRAALTCLQGELQGGREGHGFALVYFEGLSHSRDIPSELRGVPRYCLPQDFGGLVQELRGGTAGGRRPAGCQCWAGMLSKILALRLAQRLRAWLPQTWALEEEVEGAAVRLPWEPEKGSRPCRLAGLPRLFRERTERGSRRERRKLTMSAQK
ncbi:hypothetical protein AAFF_G00041330 [Aldrovandia affinis]|uniref:Uncharacterized protein n=1 Tax=Aldrovandia affinis TaxID=143900 RepID=A0AAD7S2K2_9TELE|nr:hypothetical protein AAFF_G00041330 [Aldrovandia affinis]